MPPFDRDSALNKAENALRQGRVESAIQEYVRVVEALPTDWNSANTLGDLYVRAGQIDRAVSQYGRIADHLAQEGFYPKASALFKKILKVKPTEEYALLQLGEIAIKQGLLADAKQAFAQVAERRRARKDQQGVAEMSVRIGALDPGNLDARVSAAPNATGSGSDAPEVVEVAGNDPSDRDARATTTLDATASREGEHSDLTLGEIDLSAQLFDDAPATPAPTPDAERALLYDLAHALEAEGEHGRALAVLLELDTEMAGYRDVAGRIERLSKPRARG